MSLIHIEEIAENERVKIESIEGGKQIKVKFFQLGIQEGEEAVVFQNRQKGPLILLVKEGTKIALGKGMAHKILVSRVEKKEDTAEK